MLRLTRSCPTLLGKSGSLLYFQSVLTNVIGAILGSFSRVYFGKFGHMRLWACLRVSKALKCDDTNMRTCVAAGQEHLLPKPPWHGQSIGMMEYINRVGILTGWLSRYRGRKPSTVILHLVKRHKSPLFEVDYKQI